VRRVPHPAPGPPVERPARRPPSTRHRRPRAALIGGQDATRLNIGYSRSHLGIDLSLVQHAERLGFHSVWSAEAYGSDAVSPLCWIAARTERIRVGNRDHADPGPHADPDQPPPRSPSTSSPAGASFWGWACPGRRSSRAGTGSRSASRIAKTREYVDIVRMVWKRERPVEHKGEYYQIPVRGAGRQPGSESRSSRSCTGAPDIPIYLCRHRAPQRGPRRRDRGRAAAGVLLARAHERVQPRASRRASRRRAGAKSLARFDVAPTVPIVLGPDVAACRAMIKPRLALYVGGMGRAGRTSTTSW